MNSSNPLSSHEGLPDISPRMKALVDDVIGHAACEAWSQAGCLVAKSKLIAATPVEAVRALSQAIGEMESGPDGRDFYRYAWNSAVDLAGQIAKRLGWDMNEEPPEGMLTVLHLVEEHADASEAEIARLKVDLARALESSPVVPLEERRDAARYRFVRDAYTGGDMDENAMTLTVPGACLSGTTLNAEGFDKAIDAAISLPPQGDSTNG